MSDLRWCLGVARWCRLPRTPSRRNSENMAPRRSYWSGTPLVLDRGHTNFRELRKCEVRRILRLGTSVNRVESTQTLSCLWCKGLEPAASKRATGRKEEATNAAVHDAVRLHH